MDQVSTLGDSKDPPLPPLHPESEYSKYRAHQALRLDSKSQKVFTTVKKLPEDSYGIKQVTSKQFNAAVRKSTVKKLPAKKSKNGAGGGPGVLQALGERVSKIQHKANGTTATTMTGLPWSVRRRLEGKLEPKASDSALPPRQGNYTFTYGLTKEDEDRLRGEIPTHHSVKPQPKDRSYYTSNLPSTWLHDRDSLEVTEVQDEARADEIHNEDAFYRDYLADQKAMTDSKRLITSTRTILAKTGLMPSSIDDDMIAYYQDLERMDDPDLDFTAEEREEAFEAFKAPTIKASRVQPKTYYEVRRKLESTREMIKNRKKVRLMAESKEVLGPEPPIRLFTPSFALQPEHREKVIEDHLKAEGAKAGTPMSRSEHDRRKRELMEAALQVYDPETAAYEEAMLAVSETGSQALSAASSKSKTRNDTFYYNTLTEKFQMDEGSGPKTTLHLSALPALYSDDLRIRPLDQFKGPIVGTVLREIEEERRHGIPTPHYPPGTPATRVKPLDKAGHERLQGLRVLQNYNMSKVRQKSIHHKPVMTMMNVSERYDRHGIPKSRSVLEEQLDQSASNSGPGPSKSLKPIRYQTNQYIIPIKHLAFAKYTEEPADEISSLQPSRGSIVSGAGKVKGEKGKGRKVKLSAPKKKSGVPSTTSGRKGKR